MEINYQRPSDSMPISQMQYGDVFYTYGCYWMKLNPTNKTSSYMALNLEDYHVEIFDEDSTAIAYDCQELIVR